MFNERVLTESSQTSSPTTWCTPFSFAHVWQNTLDTAPSLRGANSQRPSLAGWLHADKRRPRGSPGLKNNAISQEIMEEVSHTFPGVPVLVVEQLLFSLRYQFFGDSHVFNILVLVEAFSHENGVVPVDFSTSNEGLCKSTTWQREMYLLSYHASRHLRALLYKLWTFRVWETSPVGTDITIILNSDNRKSAVKRQITVLTKTKLWRRKRSRRKLVDCYLKIRVTCREEL